MTTEHGFWGLGSQDMKTVAVFKMRYLLLHVSQIRNQNNIAVMGFIWQVAVAGTLVTQHLVRLAHAQNSSLPEHCDLSVRRAAEDGLFNSTGTGEIDFARKDTLHPLEPWYLTQALRDVDFYADGRALRTQALTVFLSVPRSFVSSEQANNTNVCAYRMMGLNATANDDGSCDKLLSDDCLKAIDDLPGKVDDDDDCPSVDVRDACGQVFFLSTCEFLHVSLPLLKLPNWMGTEADLRPSSSAQLAHSTFQAPRAPSRPCPGRTCPTTTRHSRAWEPSRSRSTQSPTARRTTCTTCASASQSPFSSRLAWGSRALFRTNSKRCCASRQTMLQRGAGSRKETFRRRARAGCRDRGP